MGQVFSSININIKITARYLSLQHFGGGQNYSKNLLEPLETFTGSPNAAHLKNFSHTKKVVSVSYKLKISSNNLVEANSLFMKT